ncbi:uncharacterized protein LOC130137872 [Syzygium oleosum]|uniref:uncharacterized protein LOC130137872 n=1 Tax=Syzygium oleosum TaxID=219896 RepID=UPI0024BADC2E|nr:uncharacterized protein LOC130137872 [Syzygium oleosum]
MHQLVEQFIKLKPPKFDGRGNLEGASLWVEELEKAFEVLGCTDEEKVTLAVYQLQENANDWWKATRGMIFSNGTARTWAMFVEAFNDKYFSKSAREQKLSEFMRLHQGQRTVDQYEAEFARLSKFAPKMVEDPLDRARRFRDGLEPDFRSQMIPLNLRGYNEIYDRAQAIERDLADRAAASGSRFTQGRDNHQLGKRPMTGNRRFVPPARRNWIDPEFVPEDESDEEPVEEERDEVPAESGDIDHPIVIDAEPESSKEQTVQGDSDSSAEESDSEWTPSRGRRG